MIGVNERRAGNVLPRQTNLFTRNVYACDGETLNQGASNGHTCPTSYVEHLCPISQP